MGTARIKQRVRLLILFPDQDGGPFPDGACVELTIFEDGRWEITDQADAVLLTGHQDSERDFSRWVLGLPYPAASTGSVGSDGRVNCMISSRRFRTFGSPRSKASIT